MKKTVVTVLLMLSLLLVSCGQETAVTEQPAQAFDYQSKVYTVGGNGQVDPKSVAGITAIKTDAYAFLDTEYVFELDERVVTYSDNTKKGQEKTVSFLGETYRLIDYKQTLDYKTESVRADEYLASGTTHGGNLILAENGEIYALLFPVLKLDIQPTDTAEAVRAAVEKALGEEIDFSAFDNCKTYCSIQNVEEALKSGEDFGHYHFTWYRQKGEYLTDDYIKLSVLPDGTLSSLWLKNRSGHSFADVPDDISIESYLPQIEQKLKQIYTGAKTELKEFSFQDILITVFEGQYCFDCRIGVKYLQGENKKEWSDLCELLVPLNLQTP